MQDYSLWRVSVDQAARGNGLASKLITEAGPTLPILTTLLLGLLYKYVCLDYFWGDVLGFWYNFGGEKSPESVDRAARGNGLASKLITEAGQTLPIFTALESFLRFFVHICLS